MVDKFKKIPHFFKEVGEEAKKVNWSTREELVSITVMVVIVSVLLTCYIALVDLGFSKLVQHLLK